MFTHRGKNRTFAHNLRLASLLSFVAGIVNVAGFLSVQRLTTNVTGHFAFFVEEVFRFKLWEGFIYFLYIFFFFFGSFLSNVFVEISSKEKWKLFYALPVILESMILFLLAFFGERMILNSPDLLAF